MTPYLTSSPHSTSNKFNLEAAKSKFVSPSQDASWPKKALEQLSDQPNPNQAQGSIENVLNAKSEVELVKTKAENVDVNELENSKVKVLYSDAATTYTALLARIEREKEGMTDRVEYELRHHTKGLTKLDEYQQIKARIQSSRDDDDDYVYINDKDKNDSFLDSPQESNMLNRQIKNSGTQNSSPRTFKLSFLQDDDASFSLAKSLKESRSKVKPKLKPSDTKTTILKSNTGSTVDIDVLKLLERQALTRVSKNINTIATQRAMRQCEIELPIVLYYGSRSPGTVRVKLGDTVERVILSASEQGAFPRLAQYHISNLLMSIGNFIVPHHLELFYFYLMRPKSQDDELIWDFSVFLPHQTDVPNTKTDLLSKDNAEQQRDSKHPFRQDDLPESKVPRIVTYQWFNRHKHIWPQSMWMQYDPKVDYARAKKRVDGGALFFREN